MQKALVNNAYIDEANLHNSLKDLDWELDYARFQIWLQEKFGVKEAYIFIGFIPRFANRYDYFRECGFIVIFKDVLYTREGRVKGNCDAELVLQVVRGVYEKSFANALIVSSDGDFACLITFLQEKERLEGILSPNGSDKCSILLKRTNAPISYLLDQKEILQIENEKAPGVDGTTQGSFS